MSRGSQRGSVLAEFAIVSLATLTIIFGIIDFGRALYMYHLVAEDAREGARHAIVNGATSCAGGSPDPLQSYVTGLAPLAGPGALVVTTTCADTTICASTSATNCSNADPCTGSAAPFSSPGCLVTVNVAYSFHFFVPIVSRLTLPMSSTSTMSISQ